MKPGSRVAFISDIHGNYEALRAVVDDIDRRGIQDVFCLGDVVGYGPDPAACVDLVRSRCRVVVCGNHDEALVKGPWGFNQLARDAIEWTRKQLRPRFWRWGSVSRWKFFEDRPEQALWEDSLLVHGSPRDPTSEYILPSHVAWPPPGMFEEIFGEFERMCFVGHTHIPGAFYEGPRFVPAADLTDGVRYEGEKILINVGSVGQPRDRDWRACYLTFEDDCFVHRRIEYPVEVTQRKIRLIDDLDNRLADRLGSGE